MFSLFYKLPQYLCCIIVNIIVENISFFMGTAFDHFFKDFNNLTVKSYNNICYYSLIILYNLKQIQ